MSHNEFDAPLFGDVEAAVVDLLLTDANFTTAFPAATVSPDLVGYQEELEWVEVARKGGNVSTWQAFEKARVDFYIYAPTRARAAQLGSAVQQTVFNRMGGYVGKGVRILGGVVETGLTRTPEARTSGAARYVLSFRLTVSDQ